MALCGVILPTLLRLAGLSVRMQRMCNIMIQADKIFTYKIKHNTYSAQVMDIVCLESFRRKMILHFKDGSKEEFYGNLKDICKSSLMDYGFIYIHKSYVVNFNYIGKLKYLELTLADGQVLPVSQRRYKAIKARYLSFLDAA